MLLLSDDFCAAQNVTYHHRVFDPGVLHQTHFVLHSQAHVSIVQHPCRQMLVLYHMGHVNRSPLKPQS